MSRELERRRPLTYAEKVLAAHRRADDTTTAVRGVTDVDLLPDRVALQDALAQIVVLQFIVAGLHETAVPTTVHCDHLIRARTEAAADLERAVEENREVYDFLRSACRRTASASGRRARASSTRSSSRPMRRRVRSSSAPTATRRTRVDWARWRSASAAGTPST